MENEKISVTKKLDKLIEILDKEEGKDKKKKKFKLPLNIFLQKGKIRKNYVIVQLIRMNGGIEYKMIPIQDNTIKVGDTYHEATADYVLRYKNYPFIILPEWNIRPVKKGGETKEEIVAWKPSDNVKEAIKKGQLSSAEKFILHAIKMDQIVQRKPINFKIILIVGALLVGAYFLLSYTGVIS